MQRARAEYPEMMPKELYDKKGIKKIIILGEGLTPVLFLQWAVSILLQKDKTQF